MLSYVYVFSILLLVSFSFADDSTDVDPHAQMKCDACILISQKFGNSFLSAEEKEKTVRLDDKTITEAAESVCDEIMKGYGVMTAEGVNRLAGPLTGRDAAVPDDDENVWSTRLQDFCDEMLAELGNEKEMYEIWSTNHDRLEDMLCRREASFSACVSDKFGDWPGDDDYDYDEGDMDYIHDEF